MAVRVGALAWRVLTFPIGTWLVLGALGLTAVFLAIERPTLSDILLEASRIDGAPDYVIVWAGDDQHLVYDGSAPEPAGDDAFPDGGIQAWTASNGILELAIDPTNYPGAIRRGGRHCQHWRVDLVRHTAAMIDRASLVCRRHVG